MKLPNPLLVQIVEIEETVGKDGTISWHNFIGFSPSKRAYVTFKYHNIKETVPYDDETNEFENFVNYMNEQISNKRL